MTYTTQELIEILDRELKASWQGKRIVLSSRERINDPVVSKLLDMKQVSKVFAYQDFRNQVHQYQKQHRVSGIIWRNCHFNEQTICFPEIYNQLIPLEEDKQVLIQAKDSVINFWQEVTAGMKFWLANAPGRGRENKEAGEAREAPVRPQSDSPTQEITPRGQALIKIEEAGGDNLKITHHLKISSEYVDKLIRQAEWVEVDAARTEIYLGLCWGDPLEYRYQWAKPKSGCDRVIASHTIPSSIKI